VIDAVTLRLGLLEGCEHLSGDEDLVYWIATRPSMGICAFCWEAEQVTGEPRYGFCDAPADDPDQDMMYVAKVADELAVHISTCVLTARIWIARMVVPERAGRGGRCHERYRGGGPVFDGFS